MPPHHRHAHRRSHAAAHDPATSDPAATPGRTARADLHAPAPRRQVTGDYVGSFATATVNQVGQVVWGRFAYEHTQLGHPVATSYEVHGDLAWDNDGSTGYRVTLQRGDRTAHGTFVFSGTDHLHVALERTTLHDAGGLLIPDPDFTRELTRTSTRAAAAPSTLAGEASGDALAETTPLDANALAQVTAIVGAVRRHLRPFYEGVTPTDRMAALSALDGALRPRFAAIPTVQAEMFRTRVRAELQAAPPVEFNGVTRNELDWLATALARAVGTPGQHTAQLLELPFGAEARDAGTPHTYRFTLIETSHDFALGPHGEAHGAEWQVGPRVGVRAGVLHVEELEGPGCAHPWARTYPVVGGSIGAAAEISYSHSLPAGAQQATQTVPFHWQPDDFIGEIGGWDGAAGAHGEAGPLDGDLGPTDSGLLIYGTRIFDPIHLEMQTPVHLGAGATGGAHADVTERRVLGTPSSAPRDAETATAHAHEVRVPAQVDIQVAFATDVSDLTPAGHRALSLVVAQNLALLRAAGAFVEVDGFASRLDTEDHNRLLAQRRQRTVIEALHALVPGVEIGAGQARGEAAAEESHVPDGDNDQYWRRADVKIDGTLVLRLFGADPDPLGDYAEVDGDR